jgi:pimeloyl-ACP methyl ester carboxylesterase
MRPDLVLIHGFWSSPATWDRLIHRMRQDDEFAGLSIHTFRYESPKLRWPGSPVRIPDYDDIAQSLPAYLSANAPGTTPIAIVTHSQGGLILQRFLAWMLAEGRGRELARIRVIVMLSCPNEGSEYLRSIRAITGFGHRPQARQLNVLDRDVGEARRIVLRQIVNATVVDDRHCPIPVFVYSGRTDNIVLRESAQSMFPYAEVLPGDHFSILDPDTPGHLTVPTLKRHLREALTHTRTIADRARPDDLSAVDPTSWAVSGHEATVTAGGSEDVQLDNGHAIHPAVDDGRESVRRLVSFLEDRRILYDPATGHAVVQHLVFSGLSRSNSQCLSPEAKASIQDIRERIGLAIEDIPDSVSAANILKRMRATCRWAIDVAERPQVEIVRKDSEDCEVWSGGALTYGMTFLGLFRKKFGHDLRLLTEMYRIEVAGPLAKILSIDALYDPDVLAMAEALVGPYMRKHAGFKNMGVGWFERLCSELESVRSPWSR